MPPVYGHFVRPGWPSRPVLFSSTRSRFAVGTNAGSSSPEPVIETLGYIHALLAHTHYRSEKETGRAGACACVEAKINRESPLVTLQRLYKPKAGWRAGGGGGRGMVQGGGLSFPPLSPLFLCFYLYSFPLFSLIRRVVSCDGLRFLQDPAEGSQSLLGGRGCVSLPVARR